MSALNLSSIAPLVLPATFWATVLMILTGAAWWILRAGAKIRQDETDRPDLLVYQDQLQELDRDVNQGRISMEAAQAGRLEIGRRLIIARDRIIGEGIVLNRALVSAVALVTAVLAGGLYVVFGSPNLPDQPFSVRQAQLLARAPETLSEEEILLLLQEQAKKNPEDALPHALMAQVMVSSGRDQDALRAYQAALRRNPTNPEWIAETGGVLMRLNDNQLGPDAQRALEAALSLDPNSPSAAFYLGLARWHAGNYKDGLAIWRRAYESNAGQTNNQNLLVARAIDVLSQLDRGPDMDGSQTPKNAMMGADPKAQQAFIKAMVAARVARVTSDPANPSLRLSAARVLMMTGQVNAAKSMLQAGETIAQKDPFLKALYQTCLASIGDVASAPLTPMPKR
ncbi:c-type cytochrome biogenesis protein CcmI [Candidatus Phycosocius spiralis]|uniref:C-type cytochrome biogenesis protein CcmI n=1 Tax=Candidatus Phycosocius spiralis TaxID=2815099 RepID=A0ABQ4PX86_9PROT|nr:c-type cytochrome biogenesis protein CcmI [Candidatus Phycosocius spiralis]GIU67602.1 c-type cytochrome biogenesis protein CcmI [Candidatus Phycosocius spiralis]